MWCSFVVNLLVVTLQKKLSSGSHKVPLTEIRTVGVIPTSRLWGEGAHFIAFNPRAPKTLAAPLLGHAIIAVVVQQWRHRLTACVKVSGGYFEQSS